ncbi:MAG: hypothetical protein ABI673_05905 [Novosphingobium sp.]
MTVQGGMAAERLVAERRSQRMRKLQLAVLCALLPALSGCVAAAIPVIAAGTIAKSRANAKRDKAQQQPPPQTPAQSAQSERTAGAPVAVPPSERIPVFAGEGSARASLVPGGLVPAGMSDPVMGRKTVALDPPATPLPAPAPIDAPAFTPVAEPAPVPVTGSGGFVPVPSAPAMPLTAMPLTAERLPTPEASPEPAPAPAPIPFVPTVREVPPVAPLAETAVVAPAPAPPPERYSGTGEGTLMIPPPTRGEVVMAPTPAPTPPPAPRAAAALVPQPAPRAMTASAPGPLLRPIESTPSSGYLGFTAYAISHANAPDSSAVAGVIDLKSPLAAPHLSQCGGQAPAVVIDLDPGLSVFNPAAATPQPGLGEALAALRSAGVTVMWASALPVEQAEEVHVALARTGLDPARIDRLLLLNGPGDRKQARRAAAARNWCVIAMAGDRRGDFDEVFDYLRDPDSSIPADDLFGKGWYIAPPPLP